MSQLTADPCAEFNLTTDVLIAACDGLTYGPDGQGAPLAGYPFESLSQMARMVTDELRARVAELEAALVKIDHRATEVFTLADEKQAENEQRVLAAEAALMAAQARIAELEALLSAEQAAEEVAGAAAFEPPFVAPDWRPRAGQG